MNFKNPKPKIRKNNLSFFMKLNRFEKKHGFTLVETVIAMGIITIMITAFLAAFGPAVQSIRKSISAKEANRLATTLENELSILRPDEAKDDNYKTAFEKAFNWIKESGTGTKNDMVLLYQYRGNPNSVRSDGTLESYTPPGGENYGVPGKDYVIQSVVRRFSDPEVSVELAPGVVEGRVFCVRMTQLIRNTQGELIVSDQRGEIRDPNPGNAVVSAYADYPDAVIAFQAEFFLLESSIYSYANALNLNDGNGDGFPDSLGKPIFVRNMAVRR